MAAKIKKVAVPGSGELNSPGTRFLLGAFQFTAGVIMAIGGANALKAVPGLFFKIAAGAVSAIAIGPFLADPRNQLVTAGFTAGSLGLLFAEGSIVTVLDSALATGEAVASGVSSAAVVVSSPLGGQTALGAGIANQPVNHNIAKWIWRTIW